MRKSVGKQTEHRTDGRAVLQRVLDNTKKQLEAARTSRKRFNEQLSFSIYFANHFSAELAAAFAPEFGKENVLSGEVPAESAEGTKRTDVIYVTRSGGLGFMISLKSVHIGEQGDGDSRFTHNLKRNEEELRVEAAALHIRQPYAVLAAVMILPFEACEDAWPEQVSRIPTSSFARWVKRLWKLRGRREPEDPPTQFELAFVVLYARDGSELRFYEVANGTCPRAGRPEKENMMDLDGFVSRVKEVYRKRNMNDFRFAREGPAADAAGESEAQLP